VAIFPERYSLPHGGKNHFALYQEMQLADMQPALQHIS